ncbi:MAG: hypothetical protein R3A47_08855 [Polyangiales bacterium]
MKETLVILILLLLASSASAADCACEVSWTTRSGTGEQCASVEHEAEWTLGETDLTSPTPWCGGGVDSQCMPDSPRGQLNTAAAKLAALGSLKAIAPRTPSTRTNFGRFDFENGPTDSHERELERPPAAHR